MDRAGRRDPPHAAGCGLTGHQARADADAGPPTGAFAQTVDGAPAAGFSVAQFGYLELTRDAHGTWQGAMVALNPADWSPFLAPCATPATADQALCVKPLPPAGK